VEVAATTIAAMSGTEWAGLIAAVTALLGLIGRGAWAAFRWAFAEERRRHEEDVAEVTATIAAKNEEIRVANLRLDAKEAELREVRGRLDACLAGRRSR
jgi:hypothetical protein